MKLLTIIFILPLAVQNYPMESDLNSFSEFELPAPCDLKGSQLNECAKNYFQSFWKKFANAEGLQKLYIPPLEPVTLEEQIWTLKSGFYDFSVETKNLKIFNVKNIKIHKTEVNFFDNNKKFSVRLETSNEEETADCDYELNLKFNPYNINLQQKGHTILKMHNIHWDTVITGIIEKRNNLHYFKFKAIDAIPDIGDGTFEVKGVDSNIFADDVVRNFFNANFKGIYKMFVAETRTLWEPALFDITGAFLKNFPAELTFINWE